ncbi:hypothetical protein [uncultured Eudoraea sp.]|uniref:hypothetical protein n=1 Tax=uncultured Eudoraea sp. TaxID=1035614 RepID=UPI002618A19F|nr:hypothetical protein [uncultured Eudoraea sp.]
MKKCVLFFTLLILALLLAVLTDNKERFELLDEVVFSENNIDSLLAEEQGQIEELCTE